jgi:acyl-coenzyme A thioesterase PaaI-like protein
VAATVGPEDFVPWDHPSPVLDALGGFLRHGADPLRIGFVVGGSKVNARGLLHAGVLATIADVSIGHALAASTEPRTPLLTVSLTCDYTG